MRRKRFSAEQITAALAEAEPDMLVAKIMRAFNGYVVDESPEEANVISLNTGLVSEKAQEKVFSQLGLWRQLKTEHPGFVIGIGSCVTSQDRESIVRGTPFVNIVFDPQTLCDLPEILAETRRSLSSDFILGFPGESERDCGETLKLFQKVRFDQIFTYICGRRPGTSVVSYHYDIGNDAKMRYLEVLQQHIHSHGQTSMQARNGTHQRVPVGKRSERDHHEAADKAECSRWVNFPGDVALIDRVVEVDITHTMMNRYRGRLSTARGAA